MRLVRPISPPAVCRLAAIALAAIVACLTLIAPRADAAPFAPDSVWTAPLARNAPLVPGSAQMVRELQRQTTLPGGAWIDTSEWSTPVYTVPKDQLPIRVVLDGWGPQLQTDFAGVPLPPDAVPARGTDEHLALHQPSTDTYWEFWGLTKKVDGWHARWGGKISPASTNPGYFPYPYGSAATGLPLVGGLIRLNELSAGRIDHALAFNIPEPAADTFVWPASRTDGTATGAVAIPEGTRFRLDPTLDIDSLGLPKTAAVMARAAQQYGMVVTDRGGSVAFKGEDPAQFGANPYPTLFGGRSPDDLLQRFPWNRLQVVTPSRDAFAKSRTVPFVFRAIGDSTATGAYPSLTASGLHPAGIAVDSPIAFANLSLKRSTPAEWAGARGNRRRRAALGRRLRRLEADHPSLVTVSVGADLLRGRPACARNRRCAARLMRTRRVQSSTRRLLRRLTTRTNAHVLLVLYPRPRGGSAAGIGQVNAALRRAAAGLSKRVLVVAPPRAAKQRAIASAAIRRYARALAARR